MATGTLIALSLYFLLMLAIGLWSYRTASSDIDGYMLGGRQLSAKVTALSAGASDMSGWMLMGLPGALYISGLSSTWIAVGLVIGAYFNYLLVAPRLRVYSQIANNAITLPDFFENRFADDSHVLRLVSSVLIILFFTLYTSSGVVAGGKLFESVFGLSYHLGLYVTAGVVLAYTLFGGFLAVSLTDFVQGCIMLIALLLVPAVVMTDLGGVGQSVDLLNQISPYMTNWLVDAKTGQALSVMAIVSLMAWGLGYFGQPHILVRFMAIKSVDDMPSARRIGMGWMLLTLIGAVATGLLGRVWINQNGVDLSDPETIFIQLSQLLFHPFIGGFLLAAILAAIMSTISSQLLVTSSSITRDFYQQFLRKDASQKELVLMGRISVALVALMAIWLASDRNSNILSLVSNAWAGFGASFGPIILLSLFWRNMTRNAAIAGMLVGAITVLLWIYVFNLSSWLYEIVPGFALNMLTILVVSKLSPDSANKLQRGFDACKQHLHKS